MSSWIGHGPSFYSMSEGLEFHESESARLFTTTGESSTMNDTTHQVDSTAEILKTTLNEQEVMVEKVEYRFPDCFKDAAVAQNILVAAFNCGVIYRINMNLRESIDIIDLKDYDTEVERVFIDPTGTHIILSVKSGSVVYWHRSWKTIKLLESFRGIHIESIGWNLDPNTNDQPLHLTDHSTGLSLFGCDDGRLFEFCIIKTHEGASYTDNELVCRQVMKLPDDESVQGIYLKRFPSELESKYYVMVVTPRRLYQFIGHISTAGETNVTLGKLISSGSPLTFRNLFAPYELFPYFQEIPGKLKSSGLSISRSLLHPASKSFAFAWITGAGLFTGEVVLKDQNFTDNAIESSKLIPYEEEDSRVTSVVMTKFHILLSTSNRLSLIDRLDARTIGTFPLNKSRKAFHLFGDSETSWITSERYLYEVGLPKQNVGVWKRLSKLKCFDLALRYCPSDKEKEIVLREQADYHFRNEHYLLAALSFSKTSLDVREVASKFHKISHDDALRVYLMHKLTSITNRELFERVAHWIIDLFIEKMVSGSNQNKDITDIQSEFSGFLSDCYLTNSFIITEISKSLVCSAWIKEIVKLLVDKADYPQAIYLLLEQNQFDDVVDLLKKLNDSNLYVQFSLELLMARPLAITEAWIETGTHLKADDLLPSLIQAQNMDQHLGSHILRYLEYYVRHHPNETSQSIHDFLLYLYLRLPGDDRLMRYLEETFRFDLYFALSQCLNAGHLIAASTIYLKLDCKLDAMKVALSGQDMDAIVFLLRKMNADETTKHKLFLNALRSLIVRGELDRASSLIEEIGTLTKVHEIMDLFSDQESMEKLIPFFEKIMKSQESTLISLQKSFNDLKIGSSTISARLDTRLEGPFSVSLTCSSCHKDFDQLPFIAFVCKHSFHKDCLLAQSSENFREGFLKALECRKAQVNETYEHELRSHPAKLVRLMNSNCPICGSTALNHITQPLIQASDEEDLRSWIL